MRTNRRKPSVSGAVYFHLPGPLQISKVPKQAQANRTTAPAASFRSTALFLCSVAFLAESRADLLSHARWHHDSVHGKQHFFKNISWTQVSEIEVACQMLASQLYFNNALRSQ